MKRRTCYTELAYLIGLVALALGAALMERAGFGVSMVVAPAYLLYVKLSPIYSFVTFGMMEYTLQAVLLVLMVVCLRSFRASYLFSFLTAVLYGFLLDGAMALVALVPGSTVFLRCLFYLSGVLFCAIGVALLFHTYVSPEVYELIVKECAAKFHKQPHRVKTVYDCVSCAVGLAMSLLFFHKLVGVLPGTILCALVNGPLIGAFGRALERLFIFRDGLPFRRYFTPPEQEPLVP